jgi:long-subunit fatty acid transport protein
MNAIEEGIERLQAGWCTGAMQHLDKFCAVGAVARSLVDNDLDLDNTANGYDAFRASDEGKAIAAEVLAVRLAEPVDTEHPDAGDYDFKEMWQGMYDDGEYDQLVYDWNDEQTSVEPVLALFERAKERLS